MVSLVIGKKICLLKPLIFYKLKLLVAKHTYIKWVSCETIIYTCIQSQLDFAVYVYKSN